MIPFTIGWRAYQWGKHKKDFKAEIVAMGRDLFVASSAATAQNQAIRRLPGMIGLPGCEIGIRYVTEGKPI